MKLLKISIGGILIIFTTFLAEAQVIHRISSGINLQEAIDAGTAGDIYILEGGLFGEVQITKRVIIYGTGFYANSSESSGGTSQVVQMTLKPGSEGSYIQSIKVNNSIIVECDRVQVSRCYSRNILISANHITINSNYVTSFIRVYNNANSFTVRNNILIGRTLEIDSINPGLVSNNTFLGEPEYAGFFGYLITRMLNISNTSFINNIFGVLGTSSNPPSLIHSAVPYVLENNVFLTNYDQISSTNTVSVSPEALFIGLPTNSSNLREDERFKLSVNSPARGVGSNGIDCGAFGGAEPFILGGTPSIPSIESLQLQSNVSTNGTLNVQIKAKANQ